MKRRWGFPLVFFFSLFLSASERRERSHSHISILGSSTCDWCPNAEMGESKYKPLQAKTALSLMAPAYDRQQVQQASSRKFKETSPPVQHLVFHLPRTIKQVGKRSVLGFKSKWELFFMVCSGVYILCER